MPESIATSSRRRPGTRRMPSTGIPASSGVTSSRRARRYSPSRFCRSSIPPPYAGKGPPRLPLRVPGCTDSIVDMTVIKINAITVAADSGDELAKRFAARAGAVDGQAGFEGFELLKPTDDRTTWLVVTRWADEDSFNAWVSSPAFGAGHQSEGSGPPAGGGHPHAGGPPAAEGAAGEAPKRPVGVS